MIDLYDADLDELRKLASKVLIIFLWAHVPVALGIALALGVNWIAPTAAAAALAGGASVFWRVDEIGFPTRLAVALATVGMAATLLAEMAGHSWQSDVHMHLFVALAALALYCDPRVIIVAATAIVLHHLLLNLLFPAAVFLGGADLARVGLHVAIVALEAAVLVWLALELAQLFQVAAEKDAEIQVGRAEAYRRDSVLAERNKMSALGQLAGGVAHELNNLLQPALTLPELVRDNLPADAVESREDLDIVLQSVRQARDIVRNILTFSRKQDATLELVDLGTEVEAALNFVRELLPMGVSLFPHIGAQEMKASINRIQLTQVLTNLVLNAAHAVGDRGLIEVSLSRPMSSMAEAERLGLDPNHSYFTLAVSDNGSGMDAETMTRAFEPFFTTRPVGEGVGLGLSVVFGVMRSWGGLVTVDSTLGKGSIFTLYLPSAVEMHSAGAVAAMAA